MAKIHTLKISNYRGIKQFEQIFGITNLVCLIGRGDSGKTTLLNAISAVLSPQWNYSFSDTDFYNLDINNPIDIEVSLYDLPPELLSETKFGLYKRLLNSKGEIIDDLTLEDSEDNIDILTISLRVSKDLEPKWIVINNRENQDSKEINASDRAKLNTFLISDYIDRHFSWSKGNPLYSLLKVFDSEEEKSNTIIDALRNAKKQIDTNPFAYLQEVINKIENSASNFGLEIKDIRTSVDFKDIAVKEDKICLHDKDVPLRQMGKGSKRLLSLAIQSEVAKIGGIILIDEIEQGLEPDRVRFLVSKLINQKFGQIFTTTHSNNVLVELKANNIYLVRKNEPSLTCFDESFQGCLRNNPDAFFTKRLLVCEGATEVGMCKALDEYNISIGENSFAVSGIGVVDGTGSNFINYCDKFKQAGFDVCAFCDSDDKSINLKKVELRKSGIKIVDCDIDNSIEKQLFADLPWIAVHKLIDLAKDIKGEDSVNESIRNNFTGDLPTDWFENDNPEIRISLGKASTLVVKKSNDKEESKAWFKRIEHGIAIGEIWFNSLDEMNGKTLNSQFNDLTSWIKNV